MIMFYLGKVQVALSVMHSFQLTKFRENRPNQKSSGGAFSQHLLMIVHVVAYLIPGFVVFMLIPSGIS